MDRMPHSVERVSVSFISFHYFFRTRYLWNRLRETILDTANASLENDVKERNVSHGVHFYRQIMHRNTIHQAFLNTKTNVSSWTGNSIEELKSYDKIKFWSFKHWWWGILVKAGFPWPAIVMVAWDGTEVVYGCLPRVPGWGSVNLYCLFTHY